MKFARSPRSLLVRLDRLFSLLLMGAHHAELHVRFY